MLMCSSAPVGEGKEKGTLSKPYCLLTMIPESRLIRGGFQRGSDVCSLTQPLHSLWIEESHREKW